MDGSSRGSKSKQAKLNLPETSHPTPLSDQELQQIKKEFGLVDDPESVENGSNSCDSDISEPTTPFDSPLTEEERKLLDHFTFRTSSQCLAPGGRSASLAEVADSLIKDLEKLDFHREESEEESVSESNESHKNDSNDLGYLTVRSGAEGLETLVEHLSQENTIEKEKEFKFVAKNDDDTSINTLPISMDSGLPSLATQAHRYFVVVAIDFGTTFSGYAFAFTRDHSTTIHMMRRWEGGDPGVSNQKTPTTLLLKPDGAFHSFGYGARDFYHDLEPDQAKKWLFFEKFKMALHTKKVSCGQ